MQRYQSEREREREREKSGTLYECILMQLSISNLFLELLYQVLSIFLFFFFFSSVLIDMEEHLLKSAKMLRLTSGQLASQVHFSFLFLISLST